MTKHFTPANNSILLNPPIEDTVHKSLEKESTKRDINISLWLSKKLEFTIIANKNRVTVIWETFTKLFNSTQYEFTLMNSSWVASIWRSPLERIGILLKVKESIVVHDLKTIITNSMVKKKTKIRTLNDIKGLNIDKILHTIHQPEKRK
jgi:hypothetical protein